VTLFALLLVWGLVRPNAVVEPAPLEPLHAARTSEAYGRGVAPPGADATRAERLGGGPSAVGPGGALAQDPLGSANTGDGGLSTLDCVIEPWEIVSIRSPVTGLIGKIHADRSDLVEVGQVLVELESSVELAAVELARLRGKTDTEVQLRAAGAVLGEKRRDRAKTLFKNDALSEDLRDEAETEAKLARLELKKAREARELAAVELARARAALQRRSIRSPIAGVVTERLMWAGEVVDEETILRVAQIDPLRVQVILPSADFGRVSPGMRAGVTPEIPGDQVHVASVSVVDRVLDAASGTFGVQLELPNPDHAIPAGLHCEVRLLED
jgi:RND family efflux transporter MFP subunit